MISYSNAGVVGILVGSDGERNPSFYWMIGASAAVIPLPLFCTLAAKFLVDFLIQLGLHEAKKIHNKDNADGTEMVEIRNDDDSDDDDDPNGKFVEAEFYDYFIRYVRTDKFNKLSFPAASLFSISLVFFLLSLLGCKSLCVVQLCMYSMTRGLFSVCSFSMWEEI